MGAVAGGRQSQRPAGSVDRLAHPSNPQHGRRERSACCRQIPRSSSEGRLRRRWSEEPTGPPAGAAPRNRRGRPRGLRQETTGPPPAGAAPRNRTGEAPQALAKNDGAGPKSPPRPRRSRPKMSRLQSLLRRKRRWNSRRDLPEPACHSPEAGTGARAKLPPPPTAADRLEPRRPAAPGRAAATRRPQARPDGDAPEAAAHRRSIAPPRRFRRHPRRGRRIGNRPGEHRRIDRSRLPATTWRCRPGGGTGREKRAWSVEQLETAVQRLEKLSVREQRPRIFRDLISPAEQALVGSPASPRLCFLGGGAGRPRSASGRKEAISRIEVPAAGRSATLGRVVGATEQHNQGAVAGRLPIALAVQGRNVRHHWSRCSRPTATRTLLTNNRTSFNIKGV